MKYDRGLVEHTARILHHHDTGTTLPPNTELNAEEQAVLGRYIFRAEVLLPSIRVWTIAEAISVHERSSARAAA